MLVTPKVNLYTSWLLVVDNVTNLASIHDSLPESGNEAWKNGQLLITTQDTAAIPLETTFIDHISVSKGMEPEDASLLLTNLSGICDKELEEKVAEKLDYQPLALASAAIYIKEIRQAKASKDFGWSGYLKKIEEGKRNAMELTLAHTNPIYPNTMTKSITLAVETQSTSDKIVYDLFSFLSLCAPQPLNLSIAVNYLAKNDETDRELISSKIKRCSLLLFEEDEKSCFIRVHQVVHDAIKYLMNKEGQHQEVVKRTVKVFNQFIANISPENGTLETIHIVPHLKALFHNVSKEGTVPQVYDESILMAFANFGQTCETHCEFNVAKRFFEQLSCVEKRTFGTEHVDVATTYNNLGSVHMQLGDFKTAKEYHKHALTTFLKKLGAEDVDVATSYNHLGLVQGKLSDFKKAKEYHQCALAILEKLGAERVDVATTYNYLGEIHRRLDEFQQAIQYHHRALEIHVKKLGTKDLHVATSYADLGEIHRQLDDFQQAKVYHQRALSIRLEKLGAEHVEVASTYNYLGIVHRQLSDLEEAKDYYYLALQIRLKTLGDEHVEVAKTYCNIGIILWQLGEFEQAKENLQLAVDICVKGYHSLTI